MLSGTPLNKTRVIAEVFSYAMQPVWNRFKGNPEIVTRMEVILTPVTELL